MLFINKNHGEWVRVRHPNGDELFLTALQLPNGRRGANFYFENPNDAYLLENGEKLDWEIQERRRVVHDPTGDEFTMKLITSRYKEGVYVLGIENPSKRFDFIYRYGGRGTWPEVLRRSDHD